MAFHSVTVHGFEGPLDVLLALLEQEKLDISQVSLASVTDGYLQRIRGMETLSAEDLALFLVVASQLILLKSKRLLPQFALTKEEEDDMVSLEEQLKQYQRFRAAGKELRPRFGTAVLHARDGFIGVAVTFYPPPDDSPAFLHAAITRLLDTLPTMETTHEQAMATVVSLEERIRDVQRRLEAAVVTSFHDAMVRGASKEDVVVSFLALLELVKQQMVRVEQSSAFRDILIQKQSAP